MLLYYPSASPVINKDGNILVGTGGNQYCMECIDIQTGAILWGANCETYVVGFYGAVVSTADGAVFFSTGNIAYALEANGTRRWRFPTLDADIYGGVFTAPALFSDGSTVLMGSSTASYPNPAVGPTLYALNASSGAVLWSLRSPASVTGLALVPGVGVAFSSVGSYLKLASAGGEQLWATPYLPFGWPAVAPSAPALTPSGALLTVSPQGIFSFNATTGAATPVGNVPAGISAWPAGSVPVVDASAARVYVSMPAGDSAPGEVRAYAL